MPSPRRPTSTRRPAPRNGANAVWAGQQMILWGGFAGGYLDDTYTDATDWFLYLHP
jgi:hypothetical protein